MEVMDLIKKILKDCDDPTIIELGMADGYHTDVMLGSCTKCTRYFGFEPDPRNVVIMAKNRPHLLSKIKFFQMAVGDRNGETTFYQSKPDHNGIPYSSSISPFKRHSELFPEVPVIGQITVPVTRLDDALKPHQLGVIDLIWMDVQGAEQMVFNGAPVCLSKTRYLFTEYDDGTFYESSSTREQILERFPSWTLLYDTGSDVLLKNGQID